MPMCGWINDLTATLQPERSRDAAGQVVVVNVGLEHVGVLIAAISTHCFTPTVRYGSFIASVYSRSSGYFLVRP
jgi:hypothetical protein